MCIHTTYASPHLTSEQAMTSRQAIYNKILNRLELEQPRENARWFFIHLYAACQAEGIVSPAADLDKIKELITERLARAPHMMHAPSSQEQQALEERKKSYQSLAIINSGWDGDTHETSMSSTKIRSLLHDLNTFESLYPNAVANTDVLIEQFFRYVDTLYLHTIEHTLTGTALSENETRFLPKARASFLLLNNLNPIFANRSAKQSIDLIAPPWISLFTRFFNTPSNRQGPIDWWDAPALINHPEMSIKKILAIVWAASSDTAHFTVNQVDDNFFHLMETIYDIATSHNSREQHEFDAKNGFLPQFLLSTIDPMFPETPRDIRACHIGAATRMFLSLYAVHPLHTPLMLQTSAERSISIRNFFLQIKRKYRAKIYFMRSLLDKNHDATLSDLPWLLDNIQKEYNAVYAEPLNIQDQEVIMSVKNALLYATDSE